MNVAVFGDLHGYILLAFKLCVRWQQETGQQLDLILQVGDLGVFPDRTRLDRATRRHGERNPVVFSFQEFFMAERPEVTTLVEELSCPLLFVRGNHEDHGWLDALEQRFPNPCFPVDAYLRLWCLKTGVPYTFQRGEEAITILGIGRVGRPASFEKTKPHYIQPDEQHLLERLGDMPVDIVLTHDAPRDRIYPGSGSLEIEQALRRHQPQYHFFGHYSGPSHHRLETNGITNSYHLADLVLNPQQGQPMLGSGSMGLLRWQRRDVHTFELLDLSWRKPDETAL
jgi:hypothetical protein